MIVWPFISTPCYYPRNIPLLIQPNLQICSVLPSKGQNVGMDLVLEIQTESFHGANGDVTGGPFSVLSSVWVADHSETIGLNAYLCEQLPTCCFRNKEM